MHEPLYRPVLREAFQVSWKEKRLWVLALLAGILLSGSVYDGLWRIMNAVSPQASLTTVVGFFWSQAATSWGGTRLSDVLIGSLHVFQLSAFFLVIGFAIASLSIICQGALTFALGSGRTGKAKIKESLTIGARSFWPVLVLNVLALAILLAVRALLAMCVVMAASAGTFATAILYIVVFIVFALLVTATVIIQIFALNAMILQGSTLSQAIQRGATLLQRHWVIAFETAVLLFLISCAAWALAILMEGLLSVPMLVLFFISASISSAALFSASLFLMIALFFAILLVIGGWLVTLQYATWTRLYRRLGEGGAVPKIHRWVRELTRGYHVPGA
jgi:hypothetical protein